VKTLNDLFTDMQRQDIWEVLNSNDEDHIIQSKLLLFLIEEPNEQREQMET